MTFMPPWWRPAAHVLGRIRAWPEESQQRACRNAMLASTACAQRRADRAEAAEAYAARARPADHAAHG